MIWDPNIGSTYRKMRNYYLVHLFLFCEASRISNFKTLLLSREIEDVNAVLKFQTILMKIQNTKQKLRQEMNLVGANSLTSLDFLLAIKVGLLMYFYQSVII